MDRNLGYNIRKMRELRGYTQEHMAHGLGIDPTSYGHIESGKTKLSLERLDKIAEILKTTRQAIEEYNEESLFYIINHQGNAGQITINNATLDEVEKC